MVESGSMSLAARLVDESPDALLAMSPNGRVLSWNRGAESIFGFTAEDALGKMLDELVVPPEHREDVRRPIGSPRESMRP